MNNIKNYQDTENKIIGNLLKTPLKSKSLNQISIETKLAYVTVHKLIPNLLRKNLLKLEKKGKSNLISIDFDNSSIDNLSSAMIYERSIFLKKYPQLTILLKEIEETLANEFYSLVLFGSYVKNKIGKNSDIDLLFIMPHRKDIEDYMDKINKVLKLHSIDTHINVVATEDFIDMLNSKHTVGRSVFEQSIVLFGTEHYYAVVKKYVRTKGY